MTPQLKSGKQYGIIEPVKFSPLLTGLEDAWIFYLGHSLTLVFSPAASLSLTITYSGVKIFLLSARVYRPDYGL
jgi:hypothetical protein